MTTAIPRFVSLDDHVIEPPDVWASRLPARFREVGPRVEDLPLGTAVLDGGRFRERPGTDGPLVSYWRYEDLFMSVKRLSTAVGFPGDAVTLGGVRYDEIRPGCFQPGPRLDDMDRNWTDASLCFPNFPRFCGQTFAEARDKELALLCVRAYNDWMVEEWCAGSGGRLVPLCLVPLWDADLATAEVERNAARGVRAVAFSEIPAYLGLPSVHSGYWDHFFATCAATGTVLFLHIGSGTKMPRTSEDAPDAVSVSMGFGNCVGSLADFIFSGVLERNPDLRLVYSEGQIGWIPFFLERADDVWETHGGWSVDHGRVPERPSTYYYRQVSGCFFKDFHGVESLARVGVDNVTFETDYPHADSTWPHTKKLAGEMFAGLDDETVHKIVRGNAIRLLGLGL
ncbi:MAG TPA: amidohydrolase family protein [Acidimicrobiia bacterium]|nr:amidohydrolase family protein [Acidimicrobiia bacterium]